MQEFSKKVVWLLMINSVIWIYLSYGLAFLNRPQIAETLSTTIVAEVIAVTLIFLLEITV